MSTVKLMGCPARREEILLNGEWNDGKHVPEYFGKFLVEDYYERKVFVPQEWQGKNIFVEFNAINYVAEIFADGEAVAKHIGPWNFFKVDVTNYVAAGKEFVLGVKVSGMFTRPMGTHYGCSWPIGGFQDGSHGGIIDDVWLRAYGLVYVDDVYVSTSFRNKTITAEYALVNTTKDVQQIKILSEVYGQKDNAKGIVLQKEGITLYPGESIIEKVTVDWDNAHLWFPDDPYLYIFDTSLIVDGETVDRDKIRFGFKEIWTEKNQYRLNGIRVNLFGDYTEYSTYGSSAYWPKKDLLKENLPDTLVKLKEYNRQILRWHRHPAPNFALDIADEIGLIIDEESALYGRPHLEVVDKRVFIDNCKLFVKEWVRFRRNHPCIGIWGATNELTYKGLGSFCNTFLLEIGDEIRKYDSTRPICYDGENDIGDTTINLHYPEGYNLEPIGSIYGWRDLVNPEKPTGMGEVLHTYEIHAPTVSKLQSVDRNKWWLGMWIRGFRYCNFADVRPSCFWVTLTDYNELCSQNLKNAYAPVALFDKDYDDQGIDIYINEEYPEIVAGSMQKRTLILYNDEYRGEEIEIEVEINVDGKAFANGKKLCHLELGWHMEIPYMFQVPSVDGNELKLILKTFKNGKQKFEEARIFKLKSKDVANVTSPEVRFLDSYLCR